MADDDDPYGLGRDIPDDKIAAALAALSDSRHGMDADFLKGPLYDEFTRVIAGWKLDPDNPQSPALDDTMQAVLNDGIRAIVEGLEAASVPSMEPTSAAIIEKKARPVLELEKNLPAAGQLRTYPVNRQAIATRLARQTANVAQEIARAMGLDHATISEIDLATVRAGGRSR